MTRLSRGLFGVALAFVIAFGGSLALAAPTPTQPTAEEQLSVQATGIFDISTATVKVDSQTYTGSKLEPVPTVTFNKTELKPDVDFTCTYKNNINAGKATVVIAGAYENNVKPGSKATVTITGKGNYNGTKKVTFKVGPKVGEWKLSDGNWWYEFGDGSYLKSTFEKIGGKWYYFNADGYMVKGWCSVDGTWYYLGSDGAMITGWQEVDGDWYYFDSSGVMAHSGWEGNYYLGSDGVMLTDTTTPDGYHVGSDGEWIKNWRALSASTESYGGTVYWTPNGEVWHSTPNCSYLSRSKTIYSGTVAQSGSRAAAAGARSGCRGSAPCGC